MRSMKMFGLLAVSAMALVAFVGTTSASATAFTAAGAGNALSTKLAKKHMFYVQGYEFECEEITFAGETEGASTAQQIVAPSYKKCKAFGVVQASVTTGTCRYESKAATSGEHATIRLFNCTNATEGIKIEVNIPFVSRCVVDVPHQSISAAVRYSNPNGSEMRVTATAIGIMVDVTTSTGICPLQVGTDSTGEYEGASDLTAVGGVQYSP